MTDAPDEPRLLVPVDGPLDADVVVPGSKSITNRALVAAALAAGRSVLTGVLFADDTEAMLDSLTRLGVELTIDRDAHVVEVDGTGGVLPGGPIELDARLSGTTSRFLLPLLALGTGPYRLDGAAPLRGRPMGDVIDALVTLGSEIVPEAQPGHLPVYVRGSISRRAEVRLRADVSSQFTSGLLLAAPCRPDGLTVRLEGPVVSQPYLDLTVAVMRSFGATVSRPDPSTYVVQAGGYRAATYAIEPDASAASYFFAAPLVAGGRVRVLGLHGDAQQGDVRFVDELARVGAVVRDTPSGLEVRADGTAHGIETDFTHISDTAQTLAAVAVFADGPTTIDGIGFIRRKETDRIAGVVTELQRCGIVAHERADGLRIEPGTPHPATIETYDDHRMAMSFALLGLRVEGIRIADPGCVAKTFPTFWDVFDALGRGGNAVTPTGAE